MTTLNGLFDSAAMRGTRWSVDIRDAVSGTMLFELHAHELLKTASVAKIHLLLELASRISSGALDPLAPLDRRAVAPVGDSGLWQHLAQDVLPVVDVARLVGSVSDNLGTNVLVDLIGLDAVHARAAVHAADGSRLHDIVRDVRRAGDPATLSTGTAADWASLFVELQRRTAVSEGVSAMVLGWLAAGLDLSMVASAYGLDPLAHAGVVDRGISLWNKTGTDEGVRADVGLFEFVGDSIAYAVICNWEPRVLPDPRDHVLLTMRTIGAALRTRAFG